jgi:HK97 gp10 family phage protein
MSEYNDGLTQILGDYFDELKTVGDKAVKAIKQQIDEETDTVERELQTNTPVKTGGLKASLKRTKINTKTRYGYRLEYEGNAPDGTPYAKIANVLNNGSSTIKAKRFMTRAVKKLKGLDDRAAKRFKEKIK